MDYKHFTPEMQAEHLKRQALQAEADHFAHTLNAEMAAASGDDAQAEAQTKLAAAAAARAETATSKMAEPTPADDAKPTDAPGRQPAPR